MIATILTFFYITFISWSYGNLTLHLITKVEKNKESLSLSFFIKCFIGLATVGTLFTLISLIIPLGNLVSQLLLLFPPLFGFYFKTLRFSGLTAEIKENFTGFTIPVRIALYSCILLILPMHSWVINHPDTLTYHAQSVQWIETYRVIPGIANLLTMYGLQSSWFILCALFSFKFTGVTAFTFINAIVLLWFVIFILQKINSCIRQGKEGGKITDGFLWLALLFISFWSYTQIRLCATSGSPDFIAAIYLWLIFYLLFRFGEFRRSSLYLLLIFLSFFAATIKLQALPVIVLPLYYYYRYDKTKISSKLLLTTLTGLLVIVPFCIRNVISTGYLLFPSVYPDLFSFDWKARKDFLLITEKYITAYARTRVEFSLNLNAYKMNATEWLPVWWRFLSLADKLILVTLSVLSIFALFRSKKIFIKKNNSLLPCLFLLIAGILFWFIKAPDPRFGYGFLIPFIGILSYLFINSFEKKIKINNRWLSAGVLLFSIAILGYTAYRFSNYFIPSNILQPAGIKHYPYREIDCNGLKLNFPTGSQFCGDTPIPCTRIDCDNFMPRGKSLKDGFTIKKIN
jgi:hypothetical protein